MGMVVYANEFETKKKKFKSKIKISHNMPLLRDYNILAVQVILKNSLFCTLKRTWTVEKLACLYTSSLATKYYVHVKNVPKTPLLYF